MLDRRAFLSVFSQFGLSASLLPGVLWSMASNKNRITRETMDQAALVADIQIPGEYKDMLLERLNGAQDDFAALRELHLPNHVPPALVFDPVLPGTEFESIRRPARLSPIQHPKISTVPQNLEDLAFDSVRDLAELVRTKKISSTALTEMYLQRLKRFNPTLQFAITLTEERAKAQAREADREIARGEYRGPLHGLPWSAKDLLSVKGYPTTWGAGGYEQQTFGEDATIVQRLDAAGAVLVAKLSLGELALGDKWFGGQTRNPWNPMQESGGSSAGPASAVAAGCVAFAIGSETLGSIAGPCHLCGVTGLRPTFGLVPRTGALATSWSADKLGPICRTVEDCAIVLDAIYGPDGKDRTVKSAAVNWDAELNWRDLKIGYLHKSFEQPPKPKIPSDLAEQTQLTPEERKRRESRAASQAAFEALQAYDRRFEQAALGKLRSLGFDLIPLELPNLPFEAMILILDVETSAAFDDLTRSGRDRLLKGQRKNDWPNIFRAGQLTPAVDYVQANRARMLALEETQKVFAQADVIVATTFSFQLVATNLTGHPAVILPNGFRGPDAPVAPPQEDGSPGIGGPGTPVSLTFLGNLYGEAKLLALAKAYQGATGFHLRHPTMDHL